MTSIASDAAASAPPGQIFWRVAFRFSDLVAHQMRET